MQVSENGRGPTYKRTDPGFAVLAAALSLVIPGAGHALIRSWGQASIWFGLWIAAAITTGGAHSATALVLMVVAAIAAFISVRDNSREMSDPSPKGKLPG